MILFSLPQEKFFKSFCTFFASRKKKKIPQNLYSAIKKENSVIKKFPRQNQESFNDNDYSIKIQESAECIMKIALSHFPSFANNHKTNCPRFTKRHKSLQKTPQNLSKKSFQFSHDIFAKKKIKTQIKIKIIHKKSSFFA